VYQRVKTDIPEIKTVLQIRKKRNVKHRQKKKYTTINILDKG
jgi:hypothetical protein